MGEEVAGVPRVIGGYELIEKLGHGGMASLYLARRAGARGFVRPVAIKIVHRHLLEDPDFVQMFIDEGNLCSRLSHPNIVHVEELGESNGELYLVMELVEGCSLGGLLNFARRRKDPLPLSLAAHIVLQVADGLHAAHEARDDDEQPLELVHRDVSPSNILLSRRGHVKIIDFGIAKSVYRQHHTQARKLKGKVAYMSPEQLLREPLDRRSDIYSLGVVLWEMLANMRAFRAEDDVSLIQQVAKRPIPPISAIRDDLTDDLVLTLSRALERRREDRFETAWEFWHALAAAVPEALLVTSGDVGDQIERVIEAKGSAASFKKVRDTGSITDSRDFETEAPVVVEVSDVLDVAANSYPSHPTGFKWALGVARVLLVLLVLAGVAWWAFWSDSGPVVQAELGGPSAPTAPKAAEAAPAPRGAEAPTEDAPSELAGSARGAAPADETAGGAPADPAERADRADEDERADSVRADEPSPRPSRRSRSARRRRAARRRAAEATPAASPQAVPTDLLEDDVVAAPAPAAPSPRRPSSGARVGDVLLADEHDLDKAATIEAEEPRAKAVQEGDALLADEYQ